MTDLHVLKKLSDTGEIKFWCLPAANWSEELMFFTSFDNLIHKYPWLIPCLYIIALIVEKYLKI